MYLPTIGHKPILLKNLQLLGSAFNKPMQTYWVYGSDYRPLHNYIKTGVIELKDAEVFSDGAYEYKCYTLIAAPDALPLKIVRDLEIKLVSLPSDPLMTLPELWEDSLAHESEDIIGEACESGGCPLANLHNTYKPVPHRRWFFHDTGHLEELRGDGTLATFTIPPFMKSLMSLVDGHLAGTPITYAKWKEMLLYVASKYNIEIPQSAH